MTQTVQYDELADALARLGFTHGAAEFHGAVAGALCVSAPDSLDPLNLLGHATEDSPQSASALMQLVEQQLSALGDSEMVFAPLLPDDEEALSLRVRALCEWCEGFLYGLTTRAKLDLKACSEEAREIIEDFTQFTRAGVSDEDDEELEEAAYAELVEYIRVGVQLVFMELHPRESDAAPQAPSPTVH